MKHAAIPFSRTAGALLLACALAAPVTAGETPPVHHHDMGGMQELPASGALPGTSLFQLDLSLQPSSGSAMRFADLKGHPLLVTMFYSHCTSVCPLLTSQLQHLVASLPEAERARVQVLMVSFDTVRDTPAALEAFRSAHHIGEANWLVATASMHDVRTLAAALGIQYRELPDHGFNHSAVLTLLDADGVPRARTQSITRDDPAFLASLKALLATGRAPPATR
jgi:protein SCO1/2